MKDNLNLFCKWKTTLIIFISESRPQLILLMEDNLKFQLEDDLLIYLKMEDDLNLVQMKDKLN